MLDGNRVPTPGVTDGYAALMLDGLAAGRGFVRAETVRHEIPGVHTATLRRVLATRSAGDRIPDSDRESY